MTEINVRLVAYGNESEGVPVQVELMDARLKLIEERWLDAKDSGRFAVTAGTYMVRASTASGRKVEQVVQVTEGESAECAIALHKVSPHESHEWAYLTKAIEAPSDHALSEELFEGLWIRLWKHDQGKWGVVPLPPTGSLSREEDGVSYGFGSLGEGLYMLQTGGPEIPWKFVAVPGTYSTMVLIRPSASDQVHPLDLVVSTDNWDLEALLSLMQRGDLDRAEDLMEKRDLAERLLYTKVSNPLGAAVGAYFLLRTGALEQLHDWTTHLAEWFEWLPDGAVIRSWHLIHAARGEAAHKDKLDQARNLLLSASQRGLPVYTEGIRLLRDGLLFFDRNSKHQDAEVRQALRYIGGFSAIINQSASTLTFTGARPADPSFWEPSERGVISHGVITGEKPPIGLPSDGEPLLFINDVPLEAAVSAGFLAPGEKLIADTEAGLLEVEIETAGGLILPTGEQFKSLPQIQRTLSQSFIESARAVPTITTTGRTADAPTPAHIETTLPEKLLTIKRLQGLIKDQRLDWRVASTGQSLGDLVKGLRLDH